MSAFQARSSATSTPRSPRSRSARSALGVLRRALDDLTGLSGALLERADIAMRKAIEAVPDGTYRSVLDADGYDEDETHIECAVTVDGSTLHIDYDGTSKQIARGLNSVMKYTYAYSTYPVKCALDPDTPRNEGSYRSVTVSAPEGCILYPTFPAPVNARQLTGHLLAAAIYECSSAVPDKVIAECGGAHHAVRLQRSGPKRPFLQIFFALAVWAQAWSRTAIRAQPSRPIRFGQHRSLRKPRPSGRLEERISDGLRGWTAWEASVKTSNRSDRRRHHSPLNDDRQKYAAKGPRTGAKAPRSRLCTRTARARTSPKCARSWRSA